MNVDKDALSQELLKTFHAQFAENQRVKEQSFLQIAGYLGAIVFGYAYVYQNSKDDIPSIVAISSLVLLAFGACVVTVISYNWRRDQAVNAAIRRYSGVMGGAGAVFPENYDPATTMRTKNVLSWMPNLLVIFFLLFPVFEVLLFVSYASKAGTSWTIKRLDWSMTATAAVATIAMVATAYVPIYFRAKLLRKLG